MKAKNKLLVLFMCLVILLPLSHPMVANGWDYSGTGSGGGAASGSGSWNVWVMGVRATAVDKNGKRLSVKVGDTTYESRSIDYYGTSAYFGTYVTSSHEHSVCTMSTGATTLCAKPDLGSGGFNSQTGGYQYEVWPYQNQGLSLPMGVISGTSGYYSATLIAQMSNTLSKLGTQTYKAQADDLFARLMGQPITFFQHNSEGDCEVLKERLTDAYIIFEPLTSMARYNGTASEVAVINRNVWNLRESALPRLYNALRVDPAVGNRGLVYFTAPGSAIPVKAGTSSINAVNAAVANTHEGYGVAILAYGQTFIPEDDDWPCDYDYSYESSCASCKNTNSDYLAYTIKDTDDWNGIMSSGSSSNSNVQGYYADGSYASGDSQDPKGDVYCREEFEVYFPNALSQVYTEPGRYFLVNPEGSEINAVKSASAIPNMKLHKVYRKRQCRASVNLTPYEKESYSHYLARVNSAKRTTLSNYEKANKNELKEMGTVWFRYNEVYEDSKYNMDEPEKMILYDKYEANRLADYEQKLENTSYPEAMLTMENTTQYKLPNEYYQYIRLRDGLSMSKKPTDEPFKDVGIENIPVSYENHGVSLSSTQAKAADMQFAYDLPNNAMLKKAASNNGYLGTSMSNGGSGGNCLAKDTIMGETTSGYSCIVLLSEPPGDEPGCNSAADAAKYGVDWNPKGSYCCPVGTKYNESTGKCDDGIIKDDCDTPEEAKEEGRDWNSKHSYCCPVGTRYNESTGKCDGDFVDDCETEADANKLGVDWNAKWKYCCPAGTEYNSDSGTCDEQETDDCDTPEEAKEEGRDWNSKHSYCCPVGTKYNASDGTCEADEEKEVCKTEEDANKMDLDWNPMTRSCCAQGTTYNPETGKCSGGNEIDPVCPESECPYGCCPSGECAPMQTVDGQPLCPGYGARDVIYRTIDLENPFPGQNAEKRNTGSNWCYYNVKSHAIDCKYNNNTVKTVVTRERNGKTNGHKVYDNNHVLYEITLDTRTIQEIRDYNDDHEYDDFNLNCIEDGKYCFSRFLDNEVDISGKCDVNTKDAFISCDKDV